MSEILIENSIKSQLGATSHHPVYIKSSGNQYNFTVQNCCREKIRGKTQVSK